MTPARLLRHRRADSARSWPAIGPIGACAPCLAWIALCTHPSGYSMHTNQPAKPILQLVATTSQLEPATARLVFQRTLATWAFDLLVLRQEGLLRPSWSPRMSAWREAA